MKNYLNFETEVKNLEEELENLKASLGEQVPISGIEKVINQVIGKAFFGLGSGFADKLKASSEAERRAIVDQHLNALNSGATPVYNDKGEYVGFNMNTMDTFADKVLGADDINIFLPGLVKNASPLSKNFILKINLFFFDIFFTISLIFFFNLEAF